jgi:DNA invertase Pin-like site-specific DNA recombinase
MGSQKVVLYVRSATFKKPEEDNSVDMQLRKLREYACKHNYEILAEFMDEGANGNRINHPGLNSMLNMASNDRDMIDAILIVVMSDTCKNPSQDSTLLIPPSGGSE